MMKKFFISLIVMIMPLMLFGQSYASLWKSVEQAQDKDLPQTEYELLQKIVAKAEKGRDYGQLLKASLLSAQAMASIAPDSLKPAMEEMKLKCEATTDEVLRTVWQTVLYRVSSRNYRLDMEVERPKLTEELCGLLAQVKDKTYAPFVIHGADAEIFDNDLLHVIGFELDYEYDTLYDYYKKVGNRRAACIMAAHANRYASKDELDALIREYEDLPEVGELVLVRYNQIAYGDKGERYDYIREALDKWGRSWPRLAKLSNERDEMTNPQFRLSYDLQVSLPGQSQKVSLTDIRNVKDITMKVYKLNVRGDFDESPNNKKGYDKIKSLMEGVVSEQKREYTGHQPYEFFEDSMTLEGLPVGVYMVEFRSSPSTEIIRHLYHVTDLYTIAEDQPAKEGVRYVVVNATTGQPIAGAHLRIRDYTTYAHYEESYGVTDAKGEYLYKRRDISRRQEVFTWTDQDEACPPMNNGNHFTFYQNREIENRVCIYTDRAIYRPGQKVFASALLYQVANGMDQKVREGKSVKFQLRDANYKVVSEQSATTDAYGTCSVEFTLTSSGLTGQFSISANGQTHYFRVEEYKRPTFHVDFPEVKQAYAAGDTLTVQATAQSYAGVPVQGAKVSYKVVRRRAYWWWSYSRYWDTAVIGHTSDGDEIFTGEAVTDNDGHFNVTMPLTMPETSYPMFYNFVVTADVTDSAGETRTGQLSLPLGNRKQALSVDLAEKVLIDDQPTATFHLLNAAGKDIDAEVNYRIDNGAWQKVKTATSISLTSHLSLLTSGKHTLEAVCQNDTIEREFVVFSLDDERPATKTDDWFWQSATQFTNDGKPVTVQVGSSDPDVHIVYSVFAGNKVIKRGAVDRSDQLLNLKLTYEEEYGNGLLLTFAWVKNGQCHTHSARILRPLPDKKLRLEWSTFRDRLTPGQQEEWTLSVKDCDGHPVDAQMMATLYDQSLDQLTKHQWSLTPYLHLPLPSSVWATPSRSRLIESANRPWSSEKIDELVFSSFDESVYPSYYGYRFRRSSRGAVVEDYGAVMAEPRMMMKSAARMEGDAEVMGNDMAGGEVLKAKEVVEEPETQEEEQGDQVQMRENLNETAFFYPQLTTDKQGRIVVKFTLPESLTTWRFMGLAHTKDLYYGMLEGETVAQKDVMIQPNVPRFVREGDEATISARLFNTSKKDLTGKAVLKLINPETEAIVCELSQTVKLKAGDTTPVGFNVQCSMFNDQCSLLICQMSVSGKGFSDGEQHYLPVLPAKERVTVTLSITQHHAGTETIDLSKLIPADGTNGKLTFEYTNNPAWLMIQALPTVGTPSDDNAISQAASFYANALGRLILSRNPQAKTAFELWKQEDTQVSLTSQLEKNEDLKDLLLNETPWVMDAERETDQKHRLGDFFDENLMQNRLNSAVEKLNKLQQGDGSWSWWPDMRGSFYMTVAISEMLVRLNAMAGTQNETARMLSNAFDFMGREIVEEVKEMKEYEKKGHTVSFPSFKALQWLYIATLDGRELPADVQSANNYLLKLLKKEIKTQSIYEKALTAVILSKPDPKRAAEYAQSLKEYTVFREDMGRYYDTHRAGYSWYDYKIPTQTVAIEALQLLKPDDRQTIEEMQRWLLQEKRTQAWDTPLNSVNAVYAFLGGYEGQDDRLCLDAAQADIQVDGKALELPKATAAIGYVKTPMAADSKTLTVAKPTEGTSWGAVYAQFVQATHNIAASTSGITVKREYLDAKGNLLPLTSHPSPLKVGDRIRVRITITADRDYDFVQVMDKRAACLEPVRQLSGWHSGSYCTPKDYSTNFYFDCLSKGAHTIENEYYVDRAGRYETGTCVVECAYAPEFRGIAPSETLKIED